MKLCRTCGAPLEDDIMFCHMCGTKIEEEEMTQEAEGTTVLSDDTYFEEMQQSPMFEPDNGTTILDENFAPMPEFPEQPTVSQKKKISKGTLIAIVISALLVVIIAVVAIASSAGKDDQYDYYDDDDYGYYDDDSYDYEDDFSYNEYYSRELVDGIWEYDSDYSDEYPYCIETANGDDVYLEYDNNFTHYRVSMIVESSGNYYCYYDGPFRTLTNYEFFYPMRYELREEIYSEDDSSITGFYHSFESADDGYIDHVQQYEYDFESDEEIIVGSWDDYCDSYGEIIEQGE